MGPDTTIGLTEAMAVVPVWNGVCVPPATRLDTAKAVMSVPAKLSWLPDWANWLLVIQMLSALAPICFVSIVRGNERDGEIFNRKKRKVV